MHPFQGVPAPGVPVPPSTTERMARWMYAYGRQPNPWLRPSPWSIHESFDDATRDLFDRAFGGDPAARPDAGEWRRHLARYANPATGALRRCAVDPAHALFADGPGTECLQCALDARRGAAVQAARPARAPHPPASPATPTPVRPPRPAGMRRWGRRSSSLAAWVIGLATAGTAATLALQGNAPTAALAGPELNAESCPLAGHVTPPDTILAMFSPRNDQWYIDVSYTDFRGRNAVHWSVRTAERSVTERLVSHGAPVDLPDADGVTPLMVAAGRPDARHVAFLLEKGANAAAANAAGQTPLMYLAAACGHVEESGMLGRALEPVLLRLVQAGADLNAQDRHGRTALMHATRGSGERVRDLLVAGADPYRVDHSTRAALDIAASGPYSPDNDYIVALLQTAMDAGGWSGVPPDERDAYLDGVDIEFERRERDHPWRAREIPPDSVFILPFRP